MQVGARAEAAEEKLERRIEELQAEHKEVITVMSTNAAASLEVRVSLVANKPGTYSAYNTSLCSAVAGCLPYSLRFL